MSRVNPLAREISAKIVYYGPGLSGKTTTLQHIHKAIRPERRGELISLATEGDRTIFFDFLPVNVEQIRSMNVRLMLYTVPGQVFYGATRKLVLNGADGVVFVADSQEAARERNSESLQDLRDNLAELGIDLAQFPLVFQYNKRDIPGVLPVEVLDRELNAFGAPAIETCATTGTGVIAALKDIVRLVIRDLKRRRQAAAAAPTQAVAVVEEPTAPTVTSRVPPPAPTRPARPADTNGHLSFAPLWTEGPLEYLNMVESRIQEGDWGSAVREAAGALAILLDSLPASESAGAGGRAVLLGLDGREYLKLCRLASTPEERVTESDALFALYLLVSAQVKLRTT